MITHKIHPAFFILFVVGMMCFTCPDDDPVFPAMASFKGDFVSAVHQTSGVASIDQDETILSLMNFKTDNGPDLNLYLASDISDVASDYIDLGDLKGVDGNYNYALPGNIDYLDYKYVVVWCVAFSVNFGYAELAEQ
jgi:hypothetical protein